MLKTSLVKKLIACMAAGTLVFGAVALAGCSNSSTTSSAGNSSSAASSASKTTGVRTDSNQTGKHTATMTVKGYDPIKIELDADAAPVSVSNFMELVKNKYYDGLAFYRIQDGFVIQGGTKGNTASGNDTSLTPIVGEFKSNDKENSLADNFGKGTIAMARTNNPDSATSTFFVTLADGDTVTNALNGNYAAFGTIDENGMKTIEKIVEDYVGNVDPSSGMGIIQNPSKMPIIEKIVINN